MKSIWRVGDLQSITVFETVAKVYAINNNLNIIFIYNLFIERIVTITSKNNNTTASGGADTKTNTIPTASGGAITNTTEILQPIQKFKM